MAKNGLNVRTGVQQNSQTDLCLDLGSFDKRSLQCITNLPTVALWSVFKTLCIVSTSRSYPPSC